MFKRLDNCPQYEDILEGWETRDYFGNIQRLEIADDDVYLLSDGEKTLTLLVNDINNMILLLTTAKKYFEENS